MSGLEFTQNLALCFVGEERFPPVNARGSERRENLVEVLIQDETALFHVYGPRVFTGYDCRLHVRSTEDGPD